MSHLRERKIIEHTEKPIMNFTKLLWLNYFRPTMTERQKEDMLELLRVFKRQMEKFNITYFLYGGTLLGAYRHHGMIPWDDDVDILVDSKKKEMLKKALSQLDETHNLTDYVENDATKWKFYRLDGRPYSHKPFRYPYLDVFFFNDYNATTFYVEVENSLIPKEDVFPLVDKFFDGIPLPTPCNTIGVLNTMYSNLSECSSPSWNHSTEYVVNSNEQITIECDLLKPFISFNKRRISYMVDRVRVIEILTKDEIAIQMVRYHLPLSCSANHSYYHSNLFAENLLQFP